MNFKEMLSWENLIEMRDGIKKVLRQAVLKIKQEKRGRAKKTGREEIGKIAISRGTIKII